MEVCEVPEGPEVWRLEVVDVSSVEVEGSRLRSVEESGSMQEPESISLVRSWLNCLEDF